MIKEFNLEDKFIGVVPFSKFVGNSFIRELLIFDAIAIPHIYLFRRMVEETIKGDYPAWDFMLENGFLIDPIHPDLLKDEWVEIKDNVDILADEVLNWDFDAGPSELRARKITQKLRSQKQIDAVPVYGSTKLALDEFITGKGEVIDILIKKFPKPDEDLISLDQLFDYKSDPQTKRHIIGLRRWITKTSQSKLTYNELKDEIDYLLNEYQTHLKIHHLKYKTGVLQTFLVAAAETMEGIVQLKPTKAVDAIFGFRKREIDLLESELNAPGKEIAYILNTQEFISNKNKLSGIFRLWSKK